VEISNGRYRMNERNKLKLGFEKNRNKKVQKRGGGGWKVREVIELDSGQPRKSAKMKIGED